MHFYNSVHYEWIGKRQKGGGRSEGMYVGGRGSGGLWLSYRFNEISLDALLKQQLIFVDKIIR